MKNQFILVLAALVLSSCTGFAEENGGNAEVSDTVSSEATAADTVPVTTAVTARETTTVTTTAVTRETTLRKEEPTPIEETVLAEYLTENGSVVIPVDLSGKDTCRDGVCLETIDGVPYDDFPAKENIPIAIETAFENYFMDTEVWYTDNQGGPCSIENLIFSSGLCLDFDGDGEKESLMVIENDSTAPLARLSAVVYCNDENNTQFLAGDANGIDLHALVYSDCINLVVELFFGASGQASQLYTYDGGFNKVLDMGKGDLCAEGNRIRHDPWYDSLGGDLPSYLFYNSEKKAYELVGPEELTREELTEKLPEMSLLCQGIEEMYRTEITKIETEGWINFYFHLDDEYVRAYISEGSLHLMTNRNFSTNLHSNRKKCILDIAYGLFLPGQSD